MISFTMHVPAERKLNVGKLLGNHLLACFVKTSANILEYYSKFSQKKRFKHFMQIVSLSHTASMNAVEYIDD